MKLVVVTYLGLNLIKVSKRSFFNAVGTNLIYYLSK